MGLVSLDAVVEMIHVQTMKVMNVYENKFGKQFLLCLCLFVFVVCCFVCCLLSWFLLVPFLFSTYVRTYCIVLYRMFDTVIINAAFLFSSQKSNTKQNTT